MDSTYNDGIKAAIDVIELIRLSSPNRIEFNLGEVQKEIEKQFDPPPSSLLEVKSYGIRTLVRHVKEALEFSINGDLHAALIKIKKIKALAGDIEENLRTKYIHREKYNRATYENLAFAKRVNDSFVITYLVDDRGLPFARISQLLLEKGYKLASVTVSLKYSRGERLLDHPKNIKDYEEFKIEHEDKSISELIDLIIQPLDEEKISNVYVRAYKKMMNGKELNAKDNFHLDQLITARKSGMTYKDIADAFELVHSMARTIIEKTRKMR